MSGGLTKKQAACLEAIKRLTTADGVSPSYAELADDMGLCTRSGVHSLVHALRRRGYISFHDDSARSIRIVEPAGRESLPNLQGYDVAYLMAFRNEIDARLLALGVKP